MHWTISRAVRAISGMVLLACGYEPPRMIVQDVRDGTDAVSRRTALVVRFISFEAPRGIAAFPDGGKPRIAGQWVDVVVCDSVRNTVKWIARVVPPDEVGNGLIASVVRWTGDAIDVQFIGNRDANSPPSRRYVRVRLDGSVTSLTEAPAPDRRFMPQRCQAATDSIFKAEPPPIRPADTPQR